jgi:diacylglycerol O-acyltransferase / wax synthase
MPQAAASRRIEAVRGQLEPRLHLVPRFRQLLYRPRRGQGWPLWVDAPAFDLADRVRVHAVAAPGDQAQLLRACQELVRRRLDPARPLWELWLLPGLQGRRVGALLRLHHAVADGAAALAVFGALLDPAPSAPIPATPPWTPVPIPDTRQLLADNLRRRRQELGCGWSGLTHPGKALARARAAWPAWREVLTERPAPRISLNYPVGGGRRLALLRSRLGLIKQVAHARHATVNDVALAAVAGGLRQLLASRGVDVQQLVQRAMVTISLHHEQPGRARVNQPGWIMVPLPLGEPDPMRRLELIAAETAARKHKARPQAGSGIFRFVAGQRAWYRHFPRQRSVNLVRDQRRGSAGAAVSGRRAAAGTVPCDAGHGQPDPRRRRAVLRRAAQLRRSRRPRQLSRPGRVHPRCPHRPRRPRAIGAGARLPEHDARSRPRSLVAQMQGCHRRRDQGRQRRVRDSYAEGVSLGLR